MAAAFLDALHERWLDDSAEKDACDALEEAFSLAAALIEARTWAGFSQKEVASRMDAKQAAMARLEAAVPCPPPAP